MVARKYPCTCETQNYDLRKQDDNDRKIVADYMRHVAEEVEGGGIKQVSLHIARGAAGVSLDK